ncbi:adaptor protein MecA [Priestia abyssalis]|uniref:adaptor protein MecA n=1 Tax=Priestia abyssalis TaxID=1221450 RepID=UPI0009951A3C|nr:adaptor protein MecA [Priestia abyssalis]
MDIERINDNTVKFYVSYIDIEDRGFDRNEIWFNRERSEELFWEMMDEIHQEEEFAVEGPLWIQVQALEKGIEVIVTKAQLSKDGQKFEVPIGEDRKIDIPVDERIESMLDQQFNQGKEDEELESEDDSLQFVIRFRDFEDVISLSHRLELEDVMNQLYSFEGRYYLYVEFLEEHEMVHDLDNILSVLLEYGNESPVTIHRLQEYGNQIMEQQALKQVKQYFSQR